MWNTKVYRIQVKLSLIYKSSSICNNWQLCCLRTPGLPGGIYFSGTINSCDIDYLNEYALQLAMLRKVDLSQLNDKQIKRFKARYGKKHKELAAQISEQNAMYLYNIPSYYSDKIKGKMIDQLKESKFKSWLQAICERDIADDEAVKPNYNIINNAINYSADAKDREDIRNKYLDWTLDKN